MGRLERRQRARRDAEIRGNVLLSTGTGRRVIEAVYQASQPQQEAARFAHAEAANAAKAVNGTRDGRASVEQLDRKIAVVRAKPARENTDRIRKGIRDASKLTRQKKQDEKERQHVIKGTEKAQDEAFARWKAQADEQYRLAMLKFDAVRHTVAQRGQWASTSESISNAAKQFIVFTGLQVGLSAVKGMAMSVASDFDKMVHYLREAAAEFQGLRNTIGEVATPRGEEPSTKFTIEEGRKAQTFGLTPEERGDFQAKFLNYAGSEVGGAEGKLTDAEGKEYGSRIVGSRERGRACRIVFRTREGQTGRRCTDEAIWGRLSDPREGPGTLGSRASTAIQDHGHWRLGRGRCKDLFDRLACGSEPGRSRRPGFVACHPRNEEQGHGRGIRR